MIIVLKAIRSFVLLSSVSSLLSKAFFAFLLLAAFYLPMEKVIGCLMNR
ncbi:hypothetical protein BSPA14S_K0004 (plasmid) [Borreliella spielmanii A14S]|uniref:Uncharacterized protein n=1 Tax=Borreliella spielmanii A14S TaxID=498742 RepID=C0RBR4_9SPIR|nr:hypothetical protein BSPA14S_K0004 [Borreliella spielmanii A14S]